MGERGAWAADNVATDDKVQDRPEEKREGEQAHQGRTEGRRGEGLGGRKQPPLAREPQQRRLQLLERANLDLADALAADAIDLAQLLERLGLVG